MPAIYKKTKKQPQITLTDPQLPTHQDSEFLLLRFFLLQETIDEEQYNEDNSVNCLQRLHIPVHTPKHQEQNELNNENTIEGAEIFHAY